MIAIFKAILVVFKNSEMTFCIEEQATVREDCSIVRCPDTCALILMWETCALILMWETAYWLH